MRQRLIRMKTVVNCPIDVNDSMSLFELDCYYRYRYWKRYSCQYRRSSNSIPIAALLLELLV